VTAVELMVNRTRFGPYRLDARAPYRISLGDKQDSVVLRVLGCPLDKTIVDVY
jgi:hypothetical protein